MDDTNLIHELARIPLHLLATVLALLAAYFLRTAQLWLKRKLNVELPDPVLLEAQRVAVEAITYAEEHARAKAKEFGKAVLSSEKLDWAARYFRDHASAQVLALLDGKVKEWLESRLGLLRLEARPLVDPLLGQPMELAVGGLDPSTPEAR